MGIQKSKSITWISPKNTVWLPIKTVRIGCCWLNCRRWWRWQSSHRVTALVARALTINQNWNSFVEYIRLAIVRCNISRTEFTILVSTWNIRRLSSWDWWVWGICWVNYWRTSATRQSAIYQNRNATNLSKFATVGCICKTRTYERIVIETSGINNRSSSWSWSWSTRRSCWIIWNSWCNSCWERCTLCAWQLAKDQNGNSSNESVWYTITWLCKKRAHAWIVVDACWIVTKWFVWCQKRC